MAFVPLCGQRFNRDTVSDYFANKVFSVFVQLAFKYRQNSIHCTPLSSQSMKHYCYQITLASGQQMRCTSSVCLVSTI